MLGSSKRKSRLTKKAQAFVDDHGPGLKSDNKQKQAESVDAPPLKRAKGTQSSSPPGPRAPSTFTMSSMASLGSEGHASAAPTASSETMDDEELEASTDEPVVIVVDDQEKTDIDMEESAKEELSRSSLIVTAAVMLTVRSGLHWFMHFSTLSPKLRSKRDAVHMFSSAKPRAARL